MMRFQHFAYRKKLSNPISNITYVIPTRRTDTLSDVIHGSTEWLPKARR